MPKRSPKWPPERVSFAWLAIQGHAFLGARDVPTRHGERRLRQFFLARAAALIRLPTARQLHAVNPKSLQPPHTTRTLRAQTTCPCSTPPGVQPRSPAVTTRRYPSNFRRLPPSARLPCLCNALRLCSSKHPPSLTALHAQASSEDRRAPRGRRCGVSQRIMASQVALDSSKVAQVRRRK